MNFMDYRLPDRFWSKCIPEPNSGCWLWIGAGTGAGYGGVFFHGKNHRAHRVFYSVLVGEIPDGLELDHICRERSCVNPTHLEAVTRSENTKRGIGPAMAAKRQMSITHCPNGHEYTPQNTSMRAPSEFHPNGFRECRECISVRNKRYQDRIRMRRIPATP